MVSQRPPRMSRFPRIASYESPAYSAPQVSALVILENYLGLGIAFSILESRRRDSGGSFSKMAESCRYQAESDEFLRIDEPNVAVAVQKGPRNF
jgi:hypothetical protein